MKASVTGGKAPKKMPGAILHTQPICTETQTAVPICTRGGVATYTEAIVEISKTQTAVTAKAKT
jgi:hypothetical protein